MTAPDLPAQGKVQQHEAAHKSQAVPFCEWSNRTQKGKGKTDAEDQQHMHGITSVMFVINATQRPIKDINISPGRSCISWAKPGRNVQVLKAGQQPLTWPIHDCQ